MSPSPLLRALAYVPVLGLALLASSDADVRWHARNGQILFAAVAAVGLAATLLGIAFPSVTCLYAVSIVILSVAYVAVALLALVKAFGGERLLIPGISRHVVRRSPR